MMKKIFAFVFVTVVLVGFARGQNFVGMHKFEIQQYIKENMSSFKLDNSTRNQTYKYLKYKDEYGEETMLIFLSSNDFCTFTKLISDYSNLKYREKELNKAYQKVSDNTWEHRDGNKEYVIELNKQEWFFEIKTKKKED